MIRRISKNNDLKDLIKSCPSGVIDDIYKIEYYIQGYNIYIEANFSKVGNHLEAILPTADLQTLPNGILMRKAYYKVEDSSYPDGYYNLEFEDNMNIWLGENEGEAPIIPEYVTEQQLSETLSSYATEDWVSSQSFATESWVLSQSYITSSALSGYATESWVSDQTSNVVRWSEYSYLSVGSGIITDSNSIYIGLSKMGILIDYTPSLTAWEAVLVNNSVKFTIATDIYVSNQLSSYATQSWVSDQGYLTSVPVGYATESWVESQGYITSEELPDDIATKSWVSDQGYLKSVPSGYATESWVINYLSSESYMTDDDVRWILAGDGEDNPVMREDDLSTYATMAWVSDQGYITSTGVSGLATMSWVEAQGYITSSGVSGLATMSWVESQNYLNSQSLTGYATESWVESQGYYKPGSSETVLCTVQPTDLNPIVSTPLIIGNYTEGEYVEGVELTNGGAWLMKHYYNGGGEDYYYEFLTESNLSFYLDGYATESWVSSNFLSTTALNGYATQSWVESQGYLTSETIPSDIATQSWVSSNFLSTTTLNGYATESWVSSNFLSSTALTGYATQSWVSAQGYLTSETIPSDIATQSWVLSQSYITSSALNGYAKQSWVSSNFLSATALTGYATESWVTSQSYITSSALNGYAKQSWVSSNFLSATALTGYATESWVTSQNYITSAALNGYATESWATSQFFEESKIWTGTKSQWDALTPAQQSAYTIALVEGETSPVVLYETDGTTGLLGHNNNTYVGYWQLEDLDLTPFSCIKCYFKATTSTDSSTYTPAVEVTVNLDAAAMGTSIYTGGVMVPLPFNRNRQYLITCAVDSTKTKFQVIHQNTLWDVTASDANNNGRYLYKIEGYLK